MNERTNNNQRIHNSQLWHTWTTWYIVDVGGGGALGRDMTERAKRNVNVKPASTNHTIHTFLGLIYYIFHFFRSIFACFSFAIFVSLSPPLRPLFCAMVYGRKNVTTSDLAFVLVFWVWKFISVYTFGECFVFTSTVPSFSLDKNVNRFLPRFYFVASSFLLLPFCFHRLFLTLCWRCRLRCRFLFFRWILIYFRFVVALPLCIRYSGGENSTLETE